MLTWITSCDDAINVISPAVFRMRQEETILVLKSIEIINRKIKDENNLMLSLQQKSGGVKQQTTTTTPCRRGDFRRDKANTTHMHFGVRSSSTKSARDFIARRL
jgi:hypothetical protein